MTTAETPAEITAELDDRYGRGGRRRAGWIVLGVVVVAVVGYLGWTTFAQSAASVDVDTLGYSEVDPHSITVDFQATLQPGSPLVCAIEAQDTEHGIVGWRVIEYPADAAHTRAFRETIPTVAEATTGLVSSCWIP